MFFHHPNSIDTKTKKEISTPGVNEHIYVYYFTLFRCSDMPYQGLLYVHVRANYIYDISHLVKDLLDLWTMKGRRSYISN